MTKPDRTVLGILCMCAGVFVFTAQDTILKSVSGTYPLTEALALRSFVSVPLLALMVWWTDGFAALTKNVGFLMGRSIVLLMAYSCYYLAFPALPLADAVSLYFTVPLFVVVLAGPYLGEHSNWKVWAAVVVGLIGVVVMLRPGSGLFEPAALLSLFAAVSYAFGQLMARKKGDTISAPVYALWQNALFLIMALLVPLIFQRMGIVNAPHPSTKFLVRPWVWPTIIDALLMFSCGAIAAAGTVLLVNGYRMAPANTAAAFEYTGLIWIALFAFVFFHEIPHPSTVIGAVFIVAAGLIALKAQEKNV